ncbi:MAG TPA: hypothetical protein VL463_07450 [Kofleriaceae bacterium]|nr:hypothetical protein [Kofleriaceae bacterium]
MKRIASIVLACSLVPALAYAGNDKDKHHHHHKDKDKDKTPAPDATPAADPAPTPAPTPGPTGPASDPLAGAPSPSPAPSPTPGTPDKLPDKGHAPTDDELAKNKAIQERPWAVGVSDADQKAALAAFAEGNALIHDALFVKAADKYREALTHWKHPAIYYNLALALVNLDKPVEMYEALEKAMAYGAAPLDEDKFQRAEGYKKLVEGQLAHVELTCDQPGAKVYLDGAELFTAPGQYTGLVIVGEHTILAKGEGFSPTQISEKLAPRETVRLNVKLFTDEQLTREKRKMPVWVPYVVAGSGVLLAGVGGLVEQQASSGFKNYDTLIAQCAMTDPTGGCPSPSPTAVDTKSSAESKQTLATAGFVLGGAAIVTGVVLYIVNRPESYRIDPFAEKQEPGSVSVVPVFGPDGGGFAATVHF